MSLLYHFTKGFLILVTFHLIPVSIYSQDVISSIGIDGRAYSSIETATVRDLNGNYYILLEYDTEIEGIYVGGEFLTANRIENTPTIDNLKDAYILKFDSEHNFLNYTVVDNCPPVADFATSENYNVLSLNHNHQIPPFPITLQDSIVITPIALQGDLFLFDENLEFIRTMRPTTGRIGSVVIDSHYIYMACIISEDENFILVGEDTVFKKKIPTGEFPFSETIVLCKYDIEGDSVMWHLRIGGTGGESLRDMHFDLSKQLIIRGTSNSRNFTFNDEDTIVSYTANNPFIGRYSPEGNFSMGIINTIPGTSWFNDVSFDSAGNIYIAGGYVGPTYSVADTTLHNAIYVDFYTYRPVITKYDQFGNFLWIKQMEGQFERGEFFSIGFPVINEIILSGTFSDGVLSIGDNYYYDANNNETNNAFLLKLNSQSGDYVSHQYTQGEHTRHFLDLYQDNEQSINMLLRIYGESKIFNHTFYPVGSDEYAFYLVKLNTDFTSSISPQVPESEKILVYPNPVTNNSCYLISDLFSSGERVEFQITDIAVKNLYTGNAYSDSGSVEFKLPAFLSGTYFVTLQYNNKRYSQILIIE